MPEYHQWMLGRQSLMMEINIHLIYGRCRRTWPRYTYKGNRIDVLCSCPVSPELLELFSFLKPCLPKVAEGKIHTWSMPCLLSFPIRADISHWFLFFPFLVLWFYYPDKVLSLVFNLSNIELSGVRQPNPYRGINKPETFCLFIPWPKILALSYREKVKRDIWTNR